MGVAVETDRRYFLGGLVSSSLPYTDNLFGGEIMYLKDHLLGIGVVVFLALGSYIIYCGAKAIHPGFGQIVLGAMAIVYGVGIITILSEM